MDLKERVVLASGCFDVFHYGHLLHLQAAKRYGDILIVGLTKDRSVNKGPHRPIFNETQRTAMLSALKCVDGVVLVDSSLEALQKVKPHIFVKGIDYDNKINSEDTKFCRDNKIEIYITFTKKFSSTDLLNHESRHR